MFKKLLSIALLGCAALSMSAQQPQLQQLPLDPAVKHGTLPNGLNYYILHNEEPKERANFYIAQKVGSTLETQEQLGLAHFLEHMAFNGTTHYPGKNLLNYLQTKGIRFGADINAYTAFDQTVYNINNVPTTDKPLMDSVLLALRDWSCDILLAEDEIEAERGVIQEEWRQRSDAQNRMFTAILPQIYSEYQYQQMPIGKMEVVMNFKPETLRAYYKKWYRPDQQGIIIVGDFDAVEMEKKVVEMFSTIVMPENAAERTYAPVSDNQEPIVALYEDPELQVPMATISIKSDKIPVEFRNTDQAYIMETVFKQLLEIMLNERLSEYAVKPECNYIQAGAYFGDFYVSKTKDSFNIACYAKSNVLDAVKDAMSIVARACQTGFTDGEFSRACEKMLAAYENAYNERDKTDNSKRADEIIDHFVDNDPMPGIEMEYQFIQQILGMLPVQAINEAASQLLTKENQVIIVSQPKTDGFTLPEKATVIETVEGCLNATYEALEEQKITEPLISKLRKAGTVKVAGANPELGLETMTLSNGAKVIVKSTDFAADEILFTAIREGGKQSYEKSQAADVKLMEDAFDYSKLGNYDVTTMKRFLAGKKINLKYHVGSYTDYLDGSTTVKDLETFMQLLYASFCELGEDKEIFQNIIDQTRAVLVNQQNSPQYIFRTHLDATRYGNNPLMNILTVADLDAANYDTMHKMLQQSMANAADYTFIFTGNINAETLKPLLETYIASLPGGKAKKVKTVTPVEIAAGQITDEWNQPMETPSVMVFDIYSGTNLAYNVENQVKIDLLSDVLDMIYINTLREEEGGTYGASCGSNINPNNKQWQILYTFQTNSEQKEALMKRAHDELMNLLSNGACAEHFNKVREAALKQYEINSKTNKYWNDMLPTYARGWNIISGEKEAIESLTLDEFNKFMKDLYNGQNRIQVVMNGVAAQ